jgi:hypothetical protein
MLHRYILDAAERRILWPNWVWSDNSLAIWFNDAEINPRLVHWQVMKEDLSGLEEAKWFKEEATGVWDEVHVSWVLGFLELYKIDSFSWEEDDEKKEEEEPRTWLCMADSCKGRVNEVGYPCYTCGNREGTIWKKD